MYVSALRASIHPRSPSRSVSAVRQVSTAGGVGDVGRGMMPRLQLTRARSREQARQPVLETKDTASRLRAAIARISEINAALRTYKESGGL